MSPLAAEWSLPAPDGALHGTNDERRGSDAATWLPYPSWLNPGDNAWQMTAATLVGLMSVRASSSSTAG